jgi:hydroxypyruvate reductase
MGKTVLSMREDGARIFARAVAAVDPRAALKRIVRIQGENLKVRDRHYDLSRFRHVYVVGAGKASAAMARAVEELMIDRITEGTVTVKYGYGMPLRKIGLIEAAHPVPDEEGVRGSQKIIDVLTKTAEEDLVFSLISGGGSALTPMPADGISLKDKEAVTRLLLECGASINEFNAMRKHLSRIKGGNMARLAFPATLINLMLSDVIGDPIDVIASGPFVPDNSTFQECQEIIQRYHLREKMPPSVLNHIRLGLEGRIPETPKPGDPVFDRVQNVIIGSNRIAVTGAERKAKQLGYKTLILSSSIKGETRDVASVHAAIAREIHGTGHPVSPPACVISGGETTVTIHGSGLGGRNQEFALAAALEIEGLKHTVILSGGTDGTDGPTAAAGAIVDNTTITRAKRKGLDPHAFLSNNDSYHFFEQLGELLITGPTHTNVMDVRIILADTDENGTDRLTSHVSKARSKLRSRG